MEFSAWALGAVWWLKAMKVVCTLLLAQGNGAMHERSIWPKGGRATEQGPRPAGHQGENPEWRRGGSEGWGGAARAAGVWWAQTGARLPAVLGWPGAQPGARGGASWSWLGALGAGAESPKDWRGQTNCYRRFWAEQTNKTERARACGGVPGCVLPLFCRSPHVV